jgi:FtsZ-interacting cell division protein ZipA
VPAWEEWKADNKEHREVKAGHKRGNSGLTQQQLIELQQKLFAEAREATLSGPLPSVAAEQATAMAAAVQQVQAEQRAQAEQQVQAEQQAQDQQQQNEPEQHQQASPANGAAAAATQAAGDAAGPAPMDVGAEEGDGEDLADVSSEGIESELA